MVFKQNLWPVNRNGHEDICWYEVAKYTQENHQLENIIVINALL